jgi:hypothetical protein
MTVIRCVSLIRSYTVRFTVPLEDVDLIADGHAGSKHAGDFPGMSVEDIKERVRETMENPVRVKDLERGRKAYEGKNGTLVIHDPNHPDGGTVFRPPNFDKYWDEKLE